MTLPIVTERLVLRRYTREDVSDVFAMASHPSVARIFTGRVDISEEGIGRYIDLQNSYRPFEKNKVFELAVERKADGKVIGFLGLICQDHAQGEIGWALGVDYRGQGYATEAARALMDYGFHVLGLHRIYADTSSDNMASRKVMERLGMRQEALLRGAVHREGKWLDEAVYGMLADEWRAGGTPFAGSTSRRWKGILTHLGLVTIISLLLVLPFTILEWVNRRTFHETFPITLFGILWLLPVIFILILMPIVQAVRLGNRIWANPIGLLLRVVCLILIAGLWIGIIVDQMPCFLGVPDCD